MEKIRLSSTTPLADARTIMIGRKTELTSRARQNQEKYAFFPGSPQRIAFDALRDALRKIAYFEYDLNTNADVFEQATIGDLFGEDNTLDPEVFEIASASDGGESQTTPLATAPNTQSSPKEARV